MLVSCEKLCCGLWLHKIPLHYPESCCGQLQYSAKAPISYICFVGLSGFVLPRRYETFLRLWLFMVDCMLLAGASWVVS